MERSRHFPFVIATLAVVLFSFAVSRPAYAVPPTLNITMSSYALTAGTTADVTFQFSEIPFNFDNSDVDLSNANGSLSAIASTGAPTVYAATFTPNPGVDDDSNRILVGTQWNNINGEAPLGPSVTQNFTVHTSTAGGGSSCTTSSVTLARPNGGETFTAGNSEDVFWSMSSCHATSLSLLLSSDGGETYAVTASTDFPSSGYYRWTVPDSVSPSSRMSVELHGQGGALLASDESDGTFVIQPSSAPAPAPTPPPPAPAPAPSPVPAPPPPLPPPPPPEPPPAPAPVPAPPPAPPPPAPAPARTFPGPMAPPMPNIPVPQIATTPAPETSTPPTDTSMPTLAQNDPTAATAASTATSSDAVQGALVMGSQFVPTWLAIVLSFLLGALAMRIVQEVAKRNKFKYTKRCIHCLGSGEEPEKGALVMCGECEGTGQVEDENEPATECKNCKGEGVEPCEECEGEGKVEGSVCSACDGSGEKKDDDGEAIECAFCKGEGEVSATVKKMVSCETCDGTGKIKRD